MNVIIAATLFLVSAIGIAAQTTPDAVVRDLYKANKLKDVAKMSRAELERFFTPTLAADFFAAANSADGLDVQILYDAQDEKITAFIVSSPEMTSADTAKVPVTFKNFNVLKRIVFTLKRTGSNWRISDIDWSGEDGTLKTYLESYRQPAN